MQFTKFQREEELSELLKKMETAQRCIGDLTTIDNSSKEVDKMKRDLMNKQMSLPHSCKFVQFFQTNC